MCLGIKVQYIGRGSVSPECHVCRGWFSLSMRSVMVIAVARGMDVNKETTSKDTIVSSVLILRFCIWSRNVFTLAVVYGEGLSKGESNLDRNFETW